MTARTGWMMLIVANVLLYCVLNFYETCSAQSKDSGVRTFANAIEQRFEMLDQLTEIKNLLKEQNRLLKSGNIKVIVVEKNQ